MAPIPLVILWQDDDVLVVNKAAGIPVQPDPTGDPDLLSMIREQLREPGIGLVHRLDRPVSGAVLFSRTGRALAHLNDQFHDRTISKTYWAIVEGAMSTVVLDHVIEHDVHHHKARVGSGLSSGKQARISVSTIATGERYSLVEVVPDGGAFHQIRVQLSASGHPIKGDVKYGARRGEKDRSISLHARSIVFKLPDPGQHITVSAPAPSSGIWQALLAK